MIRLATDNSRPSEVMADPIETLLRQAHRRELAFRLFLGTVEGAVGLRDTISDAGALDMITIAVEKVVAALETLKEDR